jgi:hypothetical protein
MTSTVLAVQLWAPGLDAAFLVEGLGQASLTVMERRPAASDPNNLPLLLVYTDPLGWCQQQQIDFAASTSAALLESLPGIVMGPRPCRLVNLACVSIPALVAWCVQPLEPVECPLPHRFSEPELLDALLALELLHRQPQIADTYLALERHELSAILDHRPIDAACRQRYQDACRWEALLDARGHHASLQREISALAQQLEPFHANRLHALALEEQIQELSARFEHSLVLEQRCSDLEISFQVQQQEMEVLARRLALLEALVSKASQASLTTQIRLAQAIAC